MNWGVSLFIIAIFIVFVFFISQTKFKNKMLCRFRRPNHQLIERWVPLYVKYVVFDNGKYGVGQYFVDPRCIQMQWYDRGFNKLFPSLTPTMDFRYDTPYPLNPETFETTWQTPEVVRAAWQEHNAQEFAKGAASQGGGAKRKERFSSWFFGVIAIVLVLAVTFFLYRSQSSLAATMNKNFAAMQNQINTLK
jgi:hypothetical protein